MKSKEKLADRSVDRTCAILACAVAAAFCLHAACAAFVPVPFGDSANSSFLDDEADDRKGGFIDLGSNDLRMLPPGEQDIGGIPFVIASAATSADKACIVLGGHRRTYLAQSADVKLAKPLRGECLYLLHASSFTSPDDKPIVGSLHLVYEGGAKEERHVRIGRDVGDWTASRSYRNAVRAWTIYNNNTQVSLFVSTFPLAHGKKLAAFSFTADEGLWIVAGATVGERRKPRQVPVDLRITRTCKAPDLYEKPLPVYPAGTKPRNVVFILGDGMGIGSVTLASNYLRRRPGALVLNQLPYAGFATTYSANADVTDSAASATAFACGRKTNNSMLGMLPDRTHVKSVATCAHEAGFAVGLMTDDPFVGATPSAYYAHVPVRSYSEDIVRDASKCGFEILLGYHCKRYFLPKAKGGKRRDGRDILSEMTGNGYVLCETFASFLEAPRDKRVLGQLKDGELDDESRYGQLTQTALDRLSQGGKRFFVLIESGDPDHGSHANKPNDTVGGVVKIDWAARTAVDWSLARGGDTLVVVMADHETGGVNATVSPATGKATVHYGATSHTAAPVPVFAFGPGAELFEGLMDNTDIAKRLAQLLGLSL